MKQKKCITHIISGILAFISCVGFNLIASLIGEYPRVVLSLLILSLIVYNIYIHVAKKEDQKDQEDEKDKIKLGDKRWKHSILIVDDDESELVKINDYFHGYDYDIVTSKDLSDYRLVERFEIIISDVAGVGGGINSISVLNTIKNNYPYKVVLAMSSIQSWEDLKIDGDIISKQNIANYPKDIRNQIDFYSTKLNDYNKHWEEVQKKLVDKKTSPTEIEMFKKDYYDFISKQIKYFR